MRAAAIMIELIETAFKHGIKALMFHSSIKIELFNIISIII